MIRSYCGIPYRFLIHIFEENKKDGNNCIKFKTSKIFYTFRKLKYLNKYM